MNISSLPTPVDRQVEAFWRHWSSLPKTHHVPHLRDYLAHIPATVQADVVIADVYTEYRMRVRRFGAAVTRAAGSDLTGTDPLSICSDKAKPLASKVVWAMVNRPCGYTCMRMMQTSTNRVHQAPGIGLPIATDSPDYKSLLLFTNISTLQAQLGTNETFSKLLDVRFGAWIDLGKGVPTFP